MEALAIPGQHNSESRFAEAPSPFQHRVEHRGEVAGRRIDDLQYLGRRGLLLQRLASFGNKPRVLDRDDCLVGKGADQLDLPLGKRLNPVAGKNEDSDWLSFAQQRDADHRPEPSDRHSFWYDQLGIS
jgi:hypothetical protein